MILARFPHIYSEATTIRFIIKGMRGADEYKQLSLECISSPPATIRALKYGETVHIAFEA